jgi:exopolyphosphatase/pppGpp-phosphohydrolase
LKYRYDRQHGRHVAMLSTKLFDALMEEHALGGRERLLLQVAALLHDIGVYVNLRAHHKHSLYLLTSSQIFGLTTWRPRWWPTSRAITAAACRRRATCSTSRSTGRTG